MQSLKIPLAIFLGVFAGLISGCSFKQDVTYNYRNYGTMNNSAQVQKATMRPYQIHGKWYYPTLVKLGESHDGIASWYGPNFHGKKTSNGEIYSMYAHTAAHKTLPMNTIVRVVNKENGRTTIVRINDRGPFVAGRIIDLSKSAAQEIDMIRKGTARVRVEIIGFNGVISNTLQRANSTNSEYKVATTATAMELTQFLVQVGAFKQRQGAQHYKQSHARYGYPASIREYSIDGTPIYRVMLSGFKSQEEARDFIAAQKISGAFITTE